MSKRKIAIFTGNRAEYGLLHPLIKALSSETSLDIALLISGSHLLEEFGSTISEIDMAEVKTVKQIGLDAFDKIENEKVTSLFSLIIRQGAVILSKLKPDIIVLAADRYETFAMAITAFYMNIAIAHLFGGDISQGGHLDDSVRHSITKLAHLHFTSNEDSYQRVISLGEEPWRVFKVGLTSIDNIVARTYSSPEDIAKDFAIDLKKPIIIFTQHPVTTESDLAYGQVKESLEALKELGYQTIITYPCNDNGGGQIIKAINEYAHIPFFRIRRSLGWKDYLGALNIASVVVGNSSSGLMETPIFKIPCVNIGTRQMARLRAENVIDSFYNKDEIKKTINKAINDRDFIEKVRNCSNPYGPPGASKRITKILKSIPLNRTLLQKKITF